jgi:phosphoribosylanthranilate isomerase
MIKPLIKICGVRTPEIAEIAAYAGAHFIGLLLTSRSKRCVDITQAERIAIAARAYNAIPVAVFVDETAHQMQEICVATGITTIQLHGAIAQQQHVHLPAGYPRIYVQSVLNNGQLQSGHNTLKFCDVRRDFLLFDHIDAGQGHTFPWNAVHYQGPFRLGLAGGLSAHNVAQAISSLKPHLIDVSSGVENQFGQKDAALIQQFITAVHASTGENDA